MEIAEGDEIRVEPFLDVELATNSVSFDG